MADPIHLCHEMKGPAGVATAAQHPLRRAAVPQMNSAAQDSQALKGMMYTEAALSCRISRGDLICGWSNSSGYKLGVPLPRSLPPPPDIPIGGGPRPSLYSTIAPALLRSPSTYIGHEEA